MTLDNKVPKQDQDQTTYENDLAARRVTAISGLIPGTYDYVEVAYPTTTTEVYTFRSGGSGGNIVSIITLVYSDPATKSILISAAKT